MTHIDTALYPSKYRLMLMAVFVLLVVVLGVALGLGMWQWAVFGLVLVGVGVWTHSQNTPVHLVSSDGLWQVLMRTPRQDELWQLDIIQLTDRGLGIQIDAFVVEPMPKSLRLMIFSDMMDGENFRQLKAMAQF